MAGLMTAALPAPFEPLASGAAQALASILMVKGVLCFGSLAMGTYDEQSDVDLYVLSAPRILEAGLRQAVLASLPGVEGLEIDYAQPGWVGAWNPQSDRLRLNGIWLDVTYNTLAWLQTVVRKVRRGATSIPEMRFRPYSMLGLLEYSIILYDPDGLLERLRAGLYPYPVQLKQRLVEQNLTQCRDSLADLQDYAQRGIGNRAFHFHLERCLDGLDGLLFGLNERYPPAVKRVEQVLGKLPRLPHGFMPRYTALLETPLTPLGRVKIVKELASILDEVIEAGTQT